MSFVKKNHLLKSKQIQTECLTSWEGQIKNSEIDLLKREKESQEAYIRNLELLKLYNDKLRKFNYQKSICEFFGIDRIDRINNHLDRKILQYNQYRKAQLAICELDRLDLIFLLKERKILFQERVQFHREKQRFMKSKCYKA